MSLRKTIMRAVVLTSAALTVSLPSVGEAIATPPPGFSDSDYVTDYRHWVDCENQASVYRAQGINAKCVASDDTWHEADLYIHG